MIVIMTRDERLREWVRDPRSNADAWGEWRLADGPGQQAADQQLLQALSQVGEREPLCLFAHGDDNGIGDPGDGTDALDWDVRRLARFLASSLPRGYQGPILIQACAATVANVAPGVALELEQLRQLCGVWLYSYNRAIQIRKVFQDPTLLDRSVELQAAKVDC